LLQGRAGATRVFEILDERPEIFQAGDIRLDRASIYDVTTRSLRKRVGMSCRSRTCSPTP
jgi:hypothetical protein